MIRIAVVDDDNEFVKELCIVIKRLLKGKQAEINGFMIRLFLCRKRKNGSIISYSLIMPCPLMVLR